MAKDPDSEAYPAIAYSKKLTANSTTLNPIPLPNPPSVHSNNYPAEWQRR
jgi:hypothetical protein